MHYLGTISKVTTISLHSQGKPLNITVIQVYAPTSNAKEAEVEWFYEDLQDLLELEWLPTPIFFPGEFNGQRSLVGYNP